MIRKIPAVMILTAISLFLGAPNTHAALVLKYIAQNHTYTVYGVHDGKIVARTADGKLTALPPNGTWSVDGDLLSNCTEVVPLRISEVKKSDGLAQKNGKPQSREKVTFYASVSRLFSPFAEDAKYSVFDLLPQRDFSNSLFVIFWKNGEKTEAKMTVVAPKKFPQKSEFGFDGYATAIIGRLPRPLFAALGILHDGRWIVPSAKRRHEKQARLFLSMAWNKTKATQELLSSGVRISGTDLFGNRFLEIPASDGSADLLSTVFSTNAKSVDNTSLAFALDRAIRCNNLQAFRVLLAQRKSFKKLSYIVSRAPWGSAAPLITAAGFGRTEMVSELINKGMKIDAATPENENALSAALNADQGKMALFLLSRGVTLHETKSDLNESLVAAASKGHADCVRALLQLGADGNASVHGYSALVAAINSKSLDTFGVFLKKGASINQSNDKGNTPLMTAALVGNLPAAQALLARGADPKERDRNGFGPMHRAALGGHIKIGKLLHAHGAPLDALSKSGQDPLDLAIESDHMRFADWLIRSGAHLRIRQKVLPEILDAILRSDAAPMLKSALVDGLDPNTKFPGGWPLPYVAIHYRATNCLKALKALGKKLDEAPPVPLARHPDAQPRPTSIVKPTYPSGLDPLKKPLTLYFDGIIDRDGHFRFLSVHNQKAVPNKLAESARVALSSWKFVPPTANHKPCALAIRVPVVFKPDETTTGIFTLSELNVPPQAIKRGMPIYPLALKEAGISGVVILTAIIDTKGNIAKIVGIQASDRGFIEPAVEALRRSKFRPGYHHGKPVDVEVNIPIRFTLRIGN